MCPANMFRFSPAWLRGIARIAAPMRVGEIDTRPRWLQGLALDNYLFASCKERDALDGVDGGDTGGDNTRRVSTRVTTASRTLRC